MKTIMIPEPGKVMMTETEMPEVKQDVYKRQDHGREI